MEGLFGSIQENVLTLAAFNERGCPIVRNTVPIQAFGSTVHRRVAQVCFAFYDEHKHPPKDHVADLLERELEGDMADLYKDVLHGIDRLKDNINVDFVIGQIDQFNRLHALRYNITQAVEALEDDDIDRAEQAITNYHSQRRLTTTEVLGFADVSKILKHSADREILNIGLPPMVVAGVGPSPKQLFLYGAPTKSGKSWFLTHVARCALMANKKVLVITLEMSAEEWLIRVLQNFFSMPSRGKGASANVDYPKLRKLNDPDLAAYTIRRQGTKPVNAAKFGSIINTVEDRPILGHPDWWSMIEDRVKHFKFKDNMRIVERPTGSMTLQGMIGILDGLEASDNFVPDYVVLDYADLMSVKTNDYRIQLGELYKQLRGVAIERNHGLVTATQLNRKSLGMFKRGAGDIAEDISKTFTCDVFMTYSQTELEKEKMIARLSLALARHGTLPRDIVISQCYEVGQFMIEAYLADKNYVRDYNRERTRRLGLNEEDDDEE